MTLAVNEIFKSLQGEGLHAGQPAYFIRLAGCNIRCAWCDTGYALTTEKSKEMSIQEVSEEILKFRPQYQDWVCITGGEPLVQEKELMELVTSLGPKFGLQTEIFTNGTLERPWWWTKVNSWVIDIKTPSAGAFPINTNWFFGRSQDAVKFVVADRTDLVFARELIHKFAISPIQKLVSPMIPNSSLAGIDRTEWLQEVWNFCVEEKVQLSYQIHKIFWGNKKGV